MYEGSHLLWQSKSSFIPSAINLIPFRYLSSFSLKCRGVRNCIFQANFQGEFTIDCIGTAGNPATFDIKLPGNQEMEYLEREKITIQDMIEKKNSMIGPPFRFNFTSSEESFVIDIYNETESIVKAVRVDFLITPSCCIMDSGFVNKIGIIFCLNIDPNSKATIIRPLLKANSSFLVTIMASNDSCKNAIILIDKYLVLKNILFNSQRS